ncbi:hypothetical protein [Arthrobacter sp. Bz4]|uniref:hypothetical protein n=1 Tax=Arthrobacter sp. Bz4 TaxID=2171979 RepID=UPI000D521FFD|nr:hypothetical protein [Arthrobacter sp. Bz4]PVE20024.1 hypothetical protein DDA93_01360 [Arthrobacter sp. Bz4]
MVSPPESTELIFTDPLVVADLRTFIARARAAEDGAVRLQATGTVLATYICILRPRILGEAIPTVLGLRTMPLAAPANVDTTVALASVSDRLARMADDDVVLQVPPTTVTESWTGVLPPRSGWEPRGDLSAELVETAARNGIREVAETVPNNPGALIVNSARGAIWGRSIEDLAVEVPAGAAFGAFALGFLAGEERPLVLTNGRWTRISTSRGHVLSRIPTVI